MRSLKCADTNVLSVFSAAYLLVRRRLSRSFGSASCAMRSKSSVGRPSRVSRSCSLDSEEDVVGVVLVSVHGSRSCPVVEEDEAGVGMMMTGEPCSLEGVEGD